MPNRENADVELTERSLQDQSGFSLIELIVTMIVFLIVTAAVFGVMQLAQTSRSVINQKVDLGKSIRVGMSLLGRDTYNAGYGYPLGSTVILPNNRLIDLLVIPDDFDASRDTVPPIIAGNDVIANTFNPVPGVMTDQVTFLFKDTTFNPVGDPGEEVSQPLNISAATTVNGIDEIVPISGSNAACRINDIFLINGNTGSALGVATGLGDTTVQFSADDVLDLNQPGVGGPLSSITTPASMLRVRMLTYFVTPDGTLTRREYANSSDAIAFVDTPLVYNVEDFQIQYVMDDGTLTDNPSAGPDGIPGNGDDEQAMLGRIRQVRYTIAVRSVEGDVLDRPQRETLVSTFSTRNLGYDAN